MLITTPDHGYVRVGKGSLVDTVLWAGHMRAYFLSWGSHIAIVSRPNSINCIPDFGGFYALPDSEACAWLPLVLLDEALST